MTRILCRFSKTYNSTKRITDTFCIYASNDFDNMPPEVAKVNRSGSTVVKVIGKNLPRLSDWTIAFEGEWKYSKKFGHTFFAEHYELLSPSTLKGIVRFLSSKTFPGIGEKTAEAIVKEFKNETLDVIEKKPNLLLRVSGINLDKMNTIKECYQKNIAYSKLCSFLATYSVSDRVASDIYESFKGNSLEDIRSNPYLLQQVKGVGFQTCEKIARSEGVALDSFIRMEGATREILLSNSEYGGNMFMLYDDFENKSLQLLNDALDPVPVSLERFREFVKAAVKAKKFVFRGKKCIFLKEYDEAEDYISAKIARFIDLNNGLDLRVAVVSSCLDDYCRNSDISFTENQKIAIIKSLMTRLSIITGGPGTGKTTILKAIIAVYRKLHPQDEITLLAPTGKAARRMSETTGHEASTIHSKLQIYEEFKAASCYIEPGLVVVDEASMVDTMLMDRLLKAVSSKENQIIFIGDTNQLPSVGPGLVLKDMIDSGEIPKSELVEVFRQSEGASIIDNANKIKNDQNDLVYDGSFEMVSVRNEEEALRKIKDIYAEEIAEYGIDNVALLSPLRRTQNRFKVVSDSLNSILQDEIVSPSTQAVSFSGNEYRLGDRVLQWRNTKLSSNGDIGTVKDIIQNDDGVFVKILWENGSETEESRESMNDITLAYSISIHKSQGSEYDCCIIPLLSDQLCRIFQKNLLYTGITRAKKKIILVCDGKKALNFCISNNRETKRNTLLMQRIKASAKKIGFM